MTRQRKRDIRRRQARRRKVKYLKQRLEAASDRGERERLTKKLKKVSRTASVLES